MAEYRNRTNRTQKYKYEYSETKSKTIDLGATIPIKAMELELGASFLNSETTKHTLSSDVDKGKTIYVKKQTKTKTKKYKNRVTPEVYLILYGEWFNYEPSYTKYTELKEKWPRYYIDDSRN